MKITLVRHGQTDQNYNQVMQGRSNNLLNDTGRRQCKKVREKFLNTKFDFCYVSPLVRVVETAFILVGDRVEICPDNRLIERNLGELENKPRNMYDAKKFWDYNLNSSEYGVEPIQDIFKRCQDFLDYVKKKHKDGHILVVTHSAPFRALHHILLNHELSNNLLDIEIDNCFFKTYTIDSK